MLLLGQNGVYESTLHFTHAPFIPTAQAGHPLHCLTAFPTSTSSTPTSSPTPTSPTPPSPSPAQPVCTFCWLSSHDVRQVQHNNQAAERFSALRTPVQASTTLSDAVSGLHLPVRKASDPGAPQWSRSSTPSSAPTPNPGLSYGPAQTGTLHPIPPTVQPSTSSTKDSSHSACHSSGPSSATTPPSYPCTSPSPSAPQTPCDDAPTN